MTPSWILATRLKFNYSFTISKNGFSLTDPCSTCERHWLDQKMCLSRKNIEFFHESELKYFCDQSEVDVFRNICPRCERVIFLVCLGTKEKSSLCQHVQDSMGFWSLVKHTNAWANNKINSKVGTTKNSKWQCKTKVKLFKLSFVF